MYPMAAGPPPARLPAASRVDKATSHLLQGPDWAVNLEICDTLNADRWQTKDVVKAVKKRLQNKDPKVQFFTLTLLETMMKNCGEYVRFEVVEQHVLQEMVKIVQKRHDMQVRDKALLLLDSWQEAFGGPGGKYPQYYWAYVELKRSGVMFPRRPVDAPPIFTPPATHHSQAYGSPRYPTGSLNERMSSDVETLSLEGLNNIRNATELLCDMVNALNPADRMAVKDEIITDLVRQCCSNQEKLMRFVSSTGDEELLKQGLEINDRIQSVLAKHDTIASGSPLPVETPSREDIRREDPTPQPSAPATAHTKAPDEEDEDDEFAQIAKRKNKSVVSSYEASSSAGDQALVPVDPVLSVVSSSVASNALVPLDSTPVSGTRTKEQDMIDLLSLTLYSPPEESADSSTQNQNGTQQSVMSNGPEVLPNYQPTAANGANYPSNNQAYPTNKGYAPYNNYVAPWAQTGQGAQPVAYPTQPPQYGSSYPAPPWAMPASANSTNPFHPATYQMPNPHVASVAPTTYPTQLIQPAIYPAPSQSYAAPLIQHVSSPAPKPMQKYNSFGSQTSNGPSMASDARMNGNQQPKETSAAVTRPYYIPDNLFGDLIDSKSFGGSKMNRSTSIPSPKGAGQPMIGGKK
ncbi:TOM1-like protein 6 isoform X2 [Phragmites australis]|uniref:TOM1-like protein 6 isoform X2 n=1 Tax=Phragmites australis TaxID=29695 RepID=UPI002D7893EB|nr:TOM1-like protein 6 isoform X2 [Phragmites australis]